MTTREEGSSSRGSRTTDSNLSWPELPPGILSRSYGFLVTPWRWLWDSNHMHSSLVLVVTSGMAPAFFSRVKGGASTEATTSLLERRPEVKGMPARRIQLWHETIGKHQLAVAFCLSKLLLSQLLNLCVTFAVLDLGTDTFLHFSAAIFALVASFAAQILRAVMQRCSCSIRTPSHVENCVSNLMLWLTFERVLSGAFALTAEDHQGAMNIPKLQWSFSPSLHEFKGIN